MEVKITQLHRSDKDKQGNAYVGRNGKPYTRLGLKTQEHGEKWLSGFENFITKDWKVGDVVEIEVETKGDYLNFKTLSETGKMWKELNRQATELANLKARVSHLEGDRFQQDEGRAEEEPDLSNLPF